MLQRKYCIECGIIKSKNGIRCRKCEDRRRLSEWPKGENNPIYKGNKASVASIHVWLNRNYGKAYYCSNGCLYQKLYEWANVSGVYTRNIKDYKQLCRSCHLILDRNTLDWNKSSYLKRKRNKKGQWA